MRSKLSIILFLFLAAVICTKEIVSIKFSSGDFTCCVEDLGEDESTGSAPGESDSDEEGESDLLFSGFFNHVFNLEIVHGARHKAYHISTSCSPYFEIHLPPPELV
jgi:hypothetical protein